MSTDGGNSTDNSTSLEMSADEIALWDKMMNDLNILGYFSVGMVSACVAFTILAILLVLALKIRGQQMTQLLFTLLTVLGLVSVWLVTGNTCLGYMSNSPFSFINTVVPAILRFYLYPLRYLPITVHYMRLAICYFGHPTWKPPFWTPAVQVRAATLGMQFFVITLFCFLLPYAVITITFICLQYQHNGFSDEDLQKSADLRNAVTIATTVLDVIFIVLSIAIAVSLFSIRKRLKKIDLDHAALLFIYFVSFIFSFAVSIFFLYFNNNVQDPITIIEISVGFSSVSTLLFFIIWILNLRAYYLRMQKKRSGGTTLGDTSRAAIGSVKEDSGNKRKESASL